MLCIFLMVNFGMTGKSAISNHTLASNVNYYLIQINNKFITFIQTADESRSKVSAKSVLKRMHGSSVLSDCLS